MRIREERKRIDFFIAGVQKAGTTALDALLREHPHLQMARVKEAHFFDNGRVDWSAPNYGKLHADFDWGARQALRGEATPIYTYWPDALERIHRYNPEARLIVALRHPTFRAFSHWRMETARGTETHSFGEAIRTGRARVQGSPGGVHRVFSYVERGSYDQQVARLLGLFPASQACFLRTDHLFSQPQVTLARVQAFLGVDRVVEGSPRYVVPLESRALASLAAEDRLYLDGLFADSIAETQRLTGLDLSDWRSADYAEPMSNRA